MPLTLLDIAKRTGSDAQIGLVEEVVNQNPEFATLPVRTVSGTSFKTTLRTGLPQGGFRGANSGIARSKSTYAQKTTECYFFDAQMAVDEQVARGDTGEVGDLLAQEASGATTDAFANIGKQFYYGKKADANGFQGLNANVNSELIVNAGGTGDNTFTAYAIWEDIKGVHFVVGNNGELKLQYEDNNWGKQYIEDDDGKSYLAYVNNFSGFIGLAFGSEWSVGCIKNITADKPLNDKLGNELLSKFKVGRKPTRWLIASNPIFLLQASRSAISNAQSDGKGNAFSPRPVEFAGVPITETGSIVPVKAW